MVINYLFCDIHNKNNTDSSLITFLEVYKKNKMQVPHKTTHRI